MGKLLVFSTLKVTELRPFAYEWFVQMYVWAVAGKSDKETIRNAPMLNHDVDFKFMMKVFVPTLNRFSAYPFHSSEISYKEQAVTPF